jgi:hypothetical protein
MRNLDTIEPFIKKDFAYYKLQNNIWCKDCDAQEAHLTRLRMNPDFIYWQYNCSGCGNTWELSLPYKRLRKLYVDYMDAEKKTDIEHYQLWQQFRLGMYYREVFKHEQDRNDFGNMLEALRLDTTTGILRKLWRKYGHHRQN